MNFTNIFAEEKITEYTEGYEDSYAVCIGINDYKNYRNLKFAESDAITIKDKFIKRGFKEVKLLLGSEATRENILESLIWLKNVSRKNDRIIFYYAGHGKIEKGTRGSISYIIPYDTSQENYTINAISIDTIKNQSKLLEAKHILYLFDSCYSGTDIMNTRNDNSFIAEMTKNSVVFMICGGTAEEETIETVDHGLFTKYILKGIDGKADYDKNRIITGSELGLYSKRWVSVKAKNFNKVQTPQYGRFSGDGEIVFYLDYGEIYENINESNKNNEKKLTVNMIEKLKKDWEKDFRKKMEKIKPYNSPINVSLMVGGGVGNPRFEENIINYLDAEVTIKLKNNFRIGGGYSLFNLEFKDEFIYDFDTYVNTLNKEEKPLSKVYGILQKKYDRNYNENVQTVELKLGTIPEEGVSFYLSFGTSYYSNDKLSVKSSFYADIYSIPKHKDLLKEYNIFTALIGFKIGINIY